MGDTDNWVACVCGRTEIEHSHGNLWKCKACGRFHDPEQLDRLADESHTLQPEEIDR